MRICDQFILRNIAGENVIIPIGEAFDKSRAVFALNDTGAMIWNYVKRGMCLEDIASAIVDEYGVDLDKAKVDVTQFVGLLSNYSMIED